MFYIFEIFLVFLLICITLIKWFKYKFSYWEKRGVVGPKPEIPFGNLKDVIKRKAQVFQPYCDNYFKYKHLPYVGMYSFLQPVLSINDPEIARHILIKDYDHFPTHGIFSGGAGDPLAGNLFNIHGPRWKSLRSKMSPIFTAGKLKTMYPLVEKIARDALRYVDVQSSEGKPINVTEFYAKYVMEIIGSVGFGVEFNGTDNSNTEFYVRGQDYFNPRNLYWTFMRSLAFFAPDFFEKLGFKRIDPKIVNFFNDLVENTVTFRRENVYRRNDFLQTLIDLKEGKVIDENEKVDNVNNVQFSMTDLTANTFLYMFAGFETSATTGQFAAYNLAKNPEIQAKARQEVLTVLEKHGGQYTYEAQNEMCYLNMVLDETMRIYPPMRALFRRCIEDYIVPTTGLVIEKGTQVFVPLQGLQMDPDLFPDPHKFDPERFSPEGKATLHPCHWMPFGEGPRKCLGIRQGYIQSKLALAKILQNYELELDSRTQQPLKIKASSLGCAAEGDIWIKFKKI